MRAKMRGLFSAINRQAPWNRIDRARGQKESIKDEERYVSLQPHVNIFFIQFFRGQGVDK